MGCSTTELNKPRLDQGPLRRVGLVNQDVEVAEWPIRRIRIARRYLWPLHQKQLAVVSIADPLEHGVGGQRNHRSATALPRDCVGNGLSAAAPDSGCKEMKSVQS